MMYKYQLLRRYKAKTQTKFITDVFDFGKMFFKGLSFLTIVVVFLALAVKDSSATAIATHDQTVGDFVEALVDVVLFAVLELVTDLLTALHLDTAILGTLGHLRPGLLHNIVSTVVGLLSSLL
ncbi:uncharacterized protein LOC106088873 [Stomoxys calcitrans]|uniref:Uncharacterized protein n=1 Tax=Stomoxys calcitrans TaxID=35570 RepID=A0A1I8PEL4_STOCA|nr:uncharacterized protein LOC106088873 [Stomoxys calcitrans]